MKIHCSKGYATNMLFRQQNSIRLPNENSRFTFLVFNYSDILQFVFVRRRGSCGVRRLSCVNNFAFLLLKN